MDIYTELEIPHQMTIYEVYHTANTLQQKLLQNTCGRLWSLTQNLESMHTMHWLACTALRQSMQPKKLGFMQVSLQTSYTGICGVKAKAQKT